MYNDIVMDHFTNPRNVGEIENADGEGTHGSTVCGDMTSVFIKVADEKISDVKFKTFGCGAAIATSSMATELIKDRTIDEVLSLTAKNIVDKLGGLPDAKIHCSVLAHSAIKSAVYDYAKKTGKEYAGLNGFNPATCGGNCAEAH